MEVETLVNGRGDLSSLAASAADSKKDRAALNEEEADLLRAKLETLKLEKQQSEEAIGCLQQEIHSLRGRLEEMQLQIDQSEADKRSLNAVAARAAELEGEVSQLQHDLVSAMSVGEEALAEAGQLRVALDELVAEKESFEGSRIALEVRITELESKLSDSEERAAALGAQKDEAVATVSKRDEVILRLASEMKALQEELFRVSEGKAKKTKEEEWMKSARIEELEKAVRELEEKNSELEGRLSGYTAKLERELAGKEERKLSPAAGKEEEEGYQFPWTVATAASVGTVVVAMSILCLHYSKRR